MTEEQSADIAQKILDLLEAADLSVTEELEILRDVVAIALVVGEVDVEVFKDSLDERIGDVVACDELIMATGVGEA